MAAPHQAMAQPLSFSATARNVSALASNECRRATAACKSVWTAAAHEFSKTTALSPALCETAGNIMAIAARTATAQPFRAICFVVGVDRGIGINGCEGRDTGRKSGQACSSG